MALRSVPRPALGVESSMFSSSGIDPPALEQGTAVDAGASSQWQRFHSLVDACAILSEAQDYKHPHRALSPETVAHHSVASTSPQSTLGEPHGIVAGASAEKRPTPLRCPPRWTPSHAAKPVPSLPPAGARATVHDGRARGPMGAVGALAGPGAQLVRRQRLPPTEVASTLPARARGGASRSSWARPTPLSCPRLPERGWAGWAGGTRSEPPTALRAPNGSPSDALARGPGAQLSANPGSAWHRA